MGWPPLLGTMRCILAVPKEGCGRAAGCAGAPCACHSMTDLSAAKLGTVHCRERSLHGLMAVHRKKGLLSTVLLVPCARHKQGVKISRGHFRKVGNEMSSCTGQCGGRRGTGPSAALGRRRRAHCENRLGRPACAARADIGRKCSAESCSGSAAGAGPSASAGTPGAPTPAVIQRWDINHMHCVRYSSLVSDLPLAFTSQVNNSC
jgi:hypothetical protein